MTSALAPLPPLDPAQRYTIEDAIRYLKTSRATIYKWIKSGELKTIEAGERPFLSTTRKGEASRSHHVGRKVAARRWVPGSEIARLCAVPSAQVAA